MDGTSVVGSVRGAAAERLSVDERALAAFRATLAVSLLVDLGMRSRDIVAFYTDAGVLPRETLAELFPGISTFSLHALSGALWAQVVLFAVAAVFAVALLVGYRSRTSAFLSFVLLASLQVRNPLVLNGGDTMLLVLLFLGFMLPLGARWSVDATARGHSGRKSGTLLSVAGAAPLVFLVTIYTTNAVLRYRGELWMSGEAVRSVFSLETVTVLLGPYLAESHALLFVINWVWVAMLTSSVLLVLLTGWLRAFLALSFVAAHTGMALTLRLGVFPLVVIAALLLFLPPVLWDRVEASAVFSRATRAVRSRVDGSVAVDARLTPERARRAVRRLVPIVAVVFLVAFLFWQGASLGYFEAPGEEELGAHPESYSWKMYSPTPKQTYGWYVVPVELSSGERVDGFRRSPVDWEAPPNPADAYPTTLWYRYLSETRHSPEPQRRAFAEYVCESAAEHYDESVHSVEVQYVEREVVLEQGEKDEEERVELLSHDCS